MSPPFPCKHQVAGIEDYYLIPIIVCYNKIIDVDLVNTWATCNYITQLILPDTLYSEPDKNAKYIINNVCDCISILY